MIGMTRVWSGKAPRTISAHCDACRGLVASAETVKGLVEQLIDRDAVVIPNGLDRHLVYCKACREGYLEALLKQATREIADG